MKKMLAVCLLLATVLSLAACANTDPTPDGMKDVAIESAGYRLYVPEAWVEQSYNVSGAKATPAENAPNVIVTVYYPDTELSIDQYWGSRCVPEYSTVFKNFTVLEEGTAKALGGKDAKLYHFSHTIGETVYECMQVITVYNFNVYVLTYTALSSEYATYIAEVDTIITNFAFK